MNYDYRDEIVEKVFRIDPVRADLILKDCQDHGNGDPVEVAMLLNAHRRLVELGMQASQPEKWTSAKPTKPGLYWYHQKDGEIDLIDLDFSDLRSDERLCVETGMTVDEISEHWGLDAWCGPLEPPEFNLPNPKLKDE